MMSWLNSINLYIKIYFMKYVFCVLTIYEFVCE